MWKWVYDVFSQIRSSYGFKILYGAKVSEYSNLAVLFWLKV